MKESVNDFFLSTGDAVMTTGSVAVNYLGGPGFSRLRAVLHFSSDHASKSADKIMQIRKAFLSGCGFLVRSINRALRSIYRALQKLGKERDCSQSTVSVNAL